MIRIVDSVIKYTIIDPTEHLISVQLAKKLLVLYRVRKTPPLGFILRHMYPVNILSS